MNGKNGAGRHAGTLKTLNHISSLDGLRAIAILLVMASHLDLGAIVPGGFGVTIFFF